MDKKTIFKLVCFVLAVAGVITVGIALIQLPRPAMVAGMVGLVVSVVSAWLLRKHG